MADSSDHPRHAKLPPQAAPPDAKQTPQTLSSSAAGDMLPDAGRRLDELSRQLSADLAALQPPAELAPNDRAEGIRLLNELESAADNLKRAIRLHTRN